ncbi:J domain-containing protein CG6693-like [Ctenocephalides felis]|uniref:J domain-containing protein CG6693-like n=1 Tax=Ctenocephalides felis TaxID=7515 RepID=UPI000E6E2C5A|nr:J domain-containing protein CG6693-like [Ctenocephalides felis]
MSRLLESCKKYFGTTNLYKILDISKDATPNEVKKAYYKLSLKVHPDRVSEEEKEEATEKFKVLGRIHSLLSNRRDKFEYDTDGTISEDDTENWCQYWNIIFREISIQDIVNYEKNYKGSDLELYDLKRAYTDGKGDINYIYSSVPFIGYEDEPRFMEILTKLIKCGELPDYKIFTEEPEKKRKKRHQRLIAKRKSFEADNVSRALEIQRNDGFTGDDEHDEALIIQQGKRSLSGGFSSIFETLDAKCRNKRKKLNIPQHKYGTRMAKQLKTGRYSY